MGSSNTSPSTPKESSTGSNDSAFTTPGSQTTDSEGPPEEGLVSAPVTMNGHGQEILIELFAENVLAKVLRVAEGALHNNNPPSQYPEFVPQSGTDAGRYVLRDADFWTCGFFPGILYLLRERAVKYPQVFPYLGHEQRKMPIASTSLRRQLERLCHSWTGPVQAMAPRTDTHDMAFIIQPSLRRDWELTGNEESLQAVLTAARSLASRYLPKAGAIRSWDCLRQADVDISSMTDDCLVIIDSMMNLDLLFYASKHLSDPSFAEIATTHARTLLTSLLRPEPTPRGTEKCYKYPLYSTYHVVNFDPRSGAIKEHRTAQGYLVNSTWARGQAWAIFGYAQTYAWTKDKQFLFAACGLADYFLWRIETAPPCVERLAADGQRKIGRYVPLWDFDAPIENESRPLRDSSAGVIAANGMLLLSQSLGALGDKALSERYREAAMKIVCDTLECCLSSERAQFTRDPTDQAAIQIEDASHGQRFDSILKNATANHNAKDHFRYSDHGLVYADYYLLEFGNQLLRVNWI